MKKVYFLSDTHLGASYFPDSREREQRVVAFLDSIKDDASQIYLLGDILDYWYEYRYVVPRGFVRFFGKITELTDSGVEIFWIIGNHDIWIFDYIPTELGVKVIDGVYVTDVLGTKMLMAHGDGVWQNDRKFRILRSLFRNKICQTLFAGIHPRWTVSFANAWSRHSRLSQSDNRKKFEGIQRVIDENVVRLIDYCRGYSNSHPDCKYYIFGHLHRVVDVPIHGDSINRQHGDACVTGKDCSSEDAGNNQEFPRMIILGDWINNFSYAVFDGKELQLKRYK